MAMMTNPQMSILFPIIGFFIISMTVLITATFPKE